MTVMQGRLGKIALSTNGTTYTTLEKLVEGTITRERDEVEKTSHDSSGNREYEAGHHNAMIEGNCIHDDGATGQEMLWTYVGNGTTIYARFRGDETVGIQEQYAQCIVTNVSQGAPLDDMATIDFSLRITGAITRAAQT